MRLTLIHRVLLVAVFAWFVLFFNQISILTKLVRSHQIFDETNNAAASDLKDELMQQQREKKELKNFYSGLILETQKSLNTNIHTDSQSQGHSSSNVKDIAHTSIRVPIPDYYNDNKSTTRHPTPSPPKKEIDCGCPHVCDKQALNKRTAKLVCKKRIEFLMEKYYDMEKKACAAASETTPFADTHLPCEMECHPEYCKDMTEKLKIEISRLEIPNPMYERYEGVVIVSKVLHAFDMPILKQMFCLLSAAYNRHVNYDLVVFTTMPWTQEEIQELQASVAPAKLTVALEGPSLEEHLESMSLKEREFLNKRCNVTEGEKLTWFHHCSEKDSHLYNNLGYSWQSEFRAYHIWNHEALKDYKYMFWIDSE